MKKYFYPEESVYHPGKYIIKPDFDLLPLHGFSSGSYNILPARIMNQTYATYLRMCRDKYGAVLIGKKTRYPMAFFTTPPTELIQLLNSRTEEILTALKKNV